MNRNVFILKENEPLLGNFSLTIEKQKLPQTEKLTKKLIGTVKRMKNF